MSVTMQQVRAILDPDEPDYAKVKALGSEALVHLEQLVHGSDLGLAAKAAYAAGLIGGTAAAPVLMAAIRSPQPTVRVAAAAAVKQMAEPVAVPLVMHLLQDRDKGVRRQALRAAAGRVDPTLREHLKRMSDTDHDPRIRAEALEILKRRP